MGFNVICAGTEVRQANCKFLGQRQGLTTEKLDKIHSIRPEILNVHRTASPLLPLQPSKGVNMQQTCESGVSRCICATLLSPFLFRSPRLSPPHCSEVTVYACVYVCVCVCTTAADCEGHAASHNFLRARNKSTLSPSFPSALKEKVCVCVCRKESEATKERESE